ncbi:MAG: CHAD domain-containing protein, partial [Planctomycetes bacterium]|nr:CHAD domain-containing protein [Planctomycetota bacterium]
ARAYRRGRKALRRADATAAPERFHELRKRVKDHLYHLRLLAPICPPLLGARRELADRLADLLGDEHDLTVLAEYAATVDDTLTAVDRVVLAALLERRRGELRAALRPLAEWLFAEPTDRLVERFASYWQTGLSQGPCGSRRTSGSAAPDGSPDRPG